MVKYELFLLEKNYFAFNSQEDIEMTQLSDLVGVKLIIYNLEGVSVDKN